MQWWLANAATYEGFMCYSSVAQLAILALGTSWSQSCKDSRQVHHPKTIPKPSRSLPNSLRWLSKSSELRSAWSSGLCLQRLTLAIQVGLKVMLFTKKVTKVVPPFLHSYNYIKQNLPSFPPRHSWFGVENLKSFGHHRLIGDRTYHFKSKKHMTIVPCSTLPCWGSA